MRRVGLIVGFLALAVAGVAAAHTTVRGVVKDIDGKTRVIVLEDGRQIRLDDRSMILVDNRPVQVSTLRPGSTVMVVSESPKAREATVPPARPRTGVETVMFTGTVARIDPETKMIVLQDGRQVKLDDRSVILVDDRPVPLSTLTPGTMVIVTSEPLRVQESALPRAVVEVEPVTGTVTRIDSGARTIVLSDGRVIQTGPDTVLLVQDRPVEFARLKEGDVVVVRPVAKGPVTGTVARVDSGARTIVLSDGRVIQTGPDTVLLVQDRPVEFARLKEGDVVVVRPVAADDVVVVRYDEPIWSGDTAVVRRGEAAVNPGRVAPWPSNVPESEMMMEPQAP